jgi:transcriptional regulator with XRE-family HTH domain
MPPTTAHPEPDPGPFGTAVIQKRLGTALRRMREDSGLRLDQVADELQVSPSTISRIETGHTVPRVWDVKALAAIYQADPDTEAQLTSWATALKTGGWWQSIIGPLQADIQYIVSLETESAEIRAHCSGAVYGLLQTREYAQEILRQMLPRDAPIAEFVELRMRRQDLVTRSADPVRLHVIADETCLRRPMAGPDVMREQLASLLEMAALANVTLQVIDLDQPFHPAMISAFTIYLPRLPDLDPEVVSIERIDHEVFEEANAGLYQASFASLSQRALTPAASRNKIEQIRLG